MAEACQRTDADCKRRVTMLTACLDAKITTLLTRARSQSLILHLKSDVSSEVPSDHTCQSPFPRSRQHFLIDSEHCESCP